MTKAEAVGQDFWIAFLAIGDDARRAFLAHLVSDPELLEDMLDAALIEEQRGQPTQSLEQILADLRREEAVPER